MYFINMHVIVHIMSLLIYFGNSSHIKRRLYGDIQKASVERHPYVVPIIRDYKLYCSGTLIREDIVLTAGHCCSLKAKEYLIYKNQKSLNLTKLREDERDNDYHIRRVKQVIQHPLYRNKPYVMNDIGFLKLYLTNAISDIISFPGLMREYDGWDDFSPLHALGWGRTNKKGYSNQLNKLQLPEYSVQDCFQRYNRKMKPEMELCAGFKYKGNTACFSDSGAPLLISTKSGNVFGDEDVVVVGLVSRARRCGGLNYPTIFTRVSSHYQWLKYSMRKV